jgi:polygalacturonase
MRMHLVTCAILTLAALASGRAVADDVPGDRFEQAEQAKRDVRVTDFGAVADGRTDCLEPIQRAIDAVSADGGVVRFPKSDQPYLVGGTIVVRSSRVELSGSGATIKLADGAANGTSNGRATESQVHVIRLTGERNRQVKNVSIKGLTIDANIFGQNDYYNPRAIVVEHADGVLVKDVKIVRTFVGLDFGAGSSNCEARDCVIEDWTEDAFDASGDADKGSGAITTNIRFVNCHARGAPDSTGNAWEIEDGVRHVRVVDCSVSDVPRGNAFGIRNHWTAGPVDVSRDIELRRVKITNVGGKYGIYSHSAPRDRFPANRLTDVRLIDVVCPAPILFYGPLERVEIAGGRFGVIHLGYDYGEKNRPEPGEPQPLDNTTVRISNTQATHININAYAGAFTLSNVLVDASGNPAFDHAINIVGDSEVRIIGCTVTGAPKAGLTLRQQASPQIVNSILWGNHQPFLLESAKPSLRHCCIQGGTPAEAIDKGGNFNKDPLFKSGPSGRFYLSNTGSGQIANSPCVDAGSEPAAFQGFDEFTARTDQTRDTGTVDVGFHYSPKREGERRE